MEQSREQTEFNDAVNHINRVNGLWAAANGGKVMKDAETWFAALTSLFCELYSYMKDDEQEELRKIIKNKASEVEMQNKQNYKSGKSQLSSILFDELLDFELKLRMIYKKSGLQIKITSDGERLLR